MDKKVNVNEIISKDGGLINKKNDKPEVSYDKASMSSKTTDANVTMGRQPTDNDEYLGLLGYSFREGDDSKLNDLDNLVYEISKLNFDFQKKELNDIFTKNDKSSLKNKKDMIGKSFDDLSDEIKIVQYDNTKKMLKKIKSVLLSKETIEEDSGVLKKMNHNNIIDKNKLAILNEKFNKIVGLILPKINNEIELLIFMEVLLNGVSFEVDHGDLFRELKSNLTKLIESK